jgi:hypothetical protein
VKKILFVLVFTLFLFPTIVVSAQQIVTWYPVEKTSWGVVAWDAVTQLVDGDPLPAPTIATLGYNIYAKNVVTSVIVPIATNILLTERQIVLPSRGSYIVGVEAQLIYVGDTQPSLSSSISWSEVPAVCLNAATFGFKFQTGPKSTGGLRRKVGS